MEYNSISFGIYFIKLNLKFLCWLVLDFLFIFLISFLSFWLNLQIPVPRKRDQEGLFFWILLASPLEPLTFPPSPPSPLSWITTKFYCSCPLNATPALLFASPSSVAINSAPYLAISSVSFVWLKHISLDVLMYGLMLQGKFKSSRKNSNLHFQFFVQFNG